MNRACRAALLVLACCMPLRAWTAPTVSLNVARITGPGWHAEGLRAELDGNGRASLGVESATLDHYPPLKAAELRCTQLAPRGIGCAAGQFRATVPAWQVVSGTWSARSKADALHLDVALPARGFSAAGLIGGAAPQVQLKLADAALADWRALAAAFGYTVPGDLAGRFDLEAGLQIKAPQQGHVNLTLRAVNYAEDSGRYASEGLGLRAELRWQGEALQALDASVQADAGQIYVDPVFLDLQNAPLHFETRAARGADSWRLRDTVLTQGDAAQLRYDGELDAKSYLPRDYAAQLEVSTLAPVVDSFLQPFLIGTRMEGLNVAGAATLRLRGQGLMPTAIDAQLREVQVDAAKLGLDLEALSGDIHWADENAAASTLRWAGGHVQRVPFGSSSLDFRAQGRGFAILQPWRQPLLGGALAVRRLALTEIGLPAFGAQFEGSLEPIDLARLCTALGWPQFGGALGGDLPGLRIGDGVWSVDGALNAQVFGGSIRVDRLRAIEPLGIVPRVAADVQLRQIDLEALTQTFSFGRITGQLDGDIENLRLLRWRPVAMNAHLYSTPGGDKPRRISQRAIDTLSSIGGGPTGLLSRGFLGFFETFAYDRIGLRCVLKDGVCRMDGVAPADDGGYYIVRGRLLPRIDVVGHQRRVSWNALLAQVEAAIASGGPSVK